MNPTLVFTSVLAGIVFIVLLTSVFRFNAFLALFLVSLVVGMVVMPLEAVIPAVLTGFGNTMKSIGLIIILGIILGQMLERGGAALRISQFIIEAFGIRHAGMSMMVTGFITGIPVFCDSGFVVLSGLQKPLIERSGKSPLLIASMLAIGLYSVHCLIPPHPGATAAAGITGVPVGTLMLWGIPVALAAALAGAGWVVMVDRKNRPSVSVSGQYKPESESPQLPSLGVSLFPLLLPLLLLSLRSAMLLVPESFPDRIRTLLMFLGEPVMALLMGILLGLLLFSRKGLGQLPGLFASSLDKSGSILAITAAGGIFGHMIQVSGFGGLAGGWLSQSGLGLFVPFLMAVGMKTAQGSSTVAIIATASMVTPVLPALQLESSFEIMLATLAMGAGSMVVSHSNDSFFWVITRFSDLEPRQVMRTYSLATLVMGIAAFTCIWVLSVFLI